MKRWQYLTIVLLLALPWVLLFGLSFWMLWHSPHWWWLCWALPVSWGLGWGLFYLWDVKPSGKVTRVLTPPGHWSAKDRESLAVISRYQQMVVGVATDRLVDPHYYLDLARQMAFDLARQYYPDEDDPLGSVTINELLAVAELALHDSAEWIGQHVPGSHLLQLKHWRWLGQAPRYAQMASNISWVAAIVVNPLNIARYLTSRMTWDGATRLVQTSVLRAFGELFVERTGFYLVELHSGRLRLGADRYRAAREQARADRRLGTGPSSDGAASTQSVSSVQTVVAVVGEVKAGKSSLINSLFGERMADVDILPRTRGAQSYRLTLASGDSLTLLDTQGYGDSGPGAAEEAELVEEGLERADIVLLVIDATSPSRQNDAVFLASLQQRFAKRPHRRSPPVIGVMTHIDALRPPLEWNPPYLWDRPHTVKEQNIRAALDFNYSALGRYLVGLVPACTDHERGRVYGVDEYVLPALIAQLDDAKACAVLRVLHEDWEQERVTMVWGQLKRAGMAVAEYLIQPRSSLPSD